MDTTDSGQVTGERATAFLCLVVMASVGGRELREPEESRRPWSQTGISGEMDEG